MIEINVRGPLCRSRSFDCPMEKGAILCWMRGGGGEICTWYVDTEAPGEVSASRS